MGMGSPMNSLSCTDVFNSTFFVLDHIPEYFIPHPDVTQGATNFADDYGDFWVQMAGGAIEPGRGYIVRPQDSYTDPANGPYNFAYAIETLYNGTVTKPTVYGAVNPHSTPNVYTIPYASTISDIVGSRISEATVHLTDNSLNLATKLSEGDCYFRSAAGDSKGRFTLSFEVSDILSNHETSLNGISIFPNPTHGILNIVSPTAGIQHVHLYDLQGRTVYCLVGNGLDNLEVNLDELASAVYLIKVTTEIGSITKRIIKE
ncbi:MAG: hypothetical protein Aureis2KO_15430 [Aureisphaera sp.]